MRRRAGEDPRLSPADAVRLLNDPEAHIRDTVVRNPRLPARVLAGLLHDRDTASTAVTNPAIPLPVLHRILAARSANTQSGLRRGRPTRPRTGGMASSRGSSWVTSLRLPPVSRTASGVPCPSVIKWCFEPARPRSTGDGPVWLPLLGL
ncbi:hypothetical protein GCM10022295_91490 [Streptomyces osmaniensis]|uniref:Leucine rich repeat variant n=1 Tax=Streptomyces osmaniensis TaxID=593134 RepID=A0ABP6Z2R5_9ACTN